MVPQRTGESCEVGENRAGLARSFCHLRAVAIAG
jgi:hypothetical protein